MEFKGYSALITGGSMGIGESVARKMAECGARVAVLARNLDRANQVAARIRQSGAEAMAIRADVTCLEQVEEAVAKVIEQFGSVDILVNNAGGSETHPFIEENETYWNQVINLNIKGTLFASQAALKHMIPKKFGKIVNISSDAGRIGSSGQVVYSTVKAGVIGFTKALAREVARYNINVNCVSAGPVNTDLLKRQPKEVIEASTRMIPLRRIAEPEEIADAVAFFCSSDASFVTGQVLSVSGGLTMAD